MRGKSNFKRVRAGPVVCDAGSLVVLLRERGSVEHGTWHAFV